MCRFDMITRSQWLRLKPGDFIKRGPLVRRVEKASTNTKKPNSLYHCRFIVLRKIRPSWTDPYPWTTYLFTDLHRTHRALQKKEK